MTRYLLDTGIAGDYIHRRNNVYSLAHEAVKNGHRIGIGLPVLAELWYGVENSSSRARNEARDALVFHAAIFADFAVRRFTLECELSYRFC